MTAKSGMTRFADVRDGSSNTLLAGSVSPDRKIPWMKPEDVTFHDEFPAPGQPGGFAAPYKSQEASGGVFLFGDGSVKAIRDDVDLQTWWDLFQIADGRPIGDVPELRPSPPRRHQQIEVIQIDRGEGGITARLLMETLEPLEGSRMPPGRPPETGPPETGEEAVAEPSEEVPETEETAPVRGVVIIDGQPVEGATVVFNHVEGKYAAVGVTDPNGNFVLRTFKQNDGAVPGVYRVAISKKTDGGADVVPMKYGDSNTSGLTAEVRAGANEFRFELSSE
jgi:hypothetical protein